MTDEQRDTRAYHPHRKDGLDRNLTRLNEADWRVGCRCTCPDCVSKYQDSRDYLRMLTILGEVNE
jgi:hypothetical protein